MQNPEKIYADLLGNTMTEVVLADSARQKKVVANVILIDGAVNPVYTCFERNELVKTASTMKEAVEWWCD